jgi:hypothetical protein
VGGGRPDVRRPSGLRGKLGTDARSLHLADTRNDADGVDGHVGETPVQFFTTTSPLSRMATMGLPPSTSTPIRSRTTCKVSDAACRSAFTTTPSPET